MPAMLSTTITPLSQLLATTLPLQAALPVPSSAPPPAALLGAFFNGLPAWMSTVMLVSLRVGVVLSLTAVLRVFAMPATVRLLLVLALSLVLATALLPFAGQTIPAPGSATLLQAALCELAIGLTLALGVLLAFAVFSIAGNLLDIQIGFGIGQVFDPASQRQLPLLTSLFNQFAVLVFFLVDGHHALLRGLSWSMERFPPGAAWPAETAATVVLGQAAALFALGFALAAPVVFSLLLVDTALGIVARNLPQMNLFAVGIPVKIVAGLLALAAWSGGAGAMMNRVYAGIHHGWKQLFSLYRSQQDVLPVQWVFMPHWQAVAGSS